MTSGRRAAVLTLIAVLAYANSLPNLCVYDDVSTVMTNKFIRDWRNLPDLFTRAYFGASGEVSYRPTVTLSYFLDFALWRLVPAGYHAMNIGLHVLSMWLLYASLRRVFRHRLFAWVAALVFAVHPVATETVNCISYREDILALTFMLSALLLFIMALSLNPPAGLEPAGGFRRWALALGSLAAFALALGAKEMAVTTPLLAGLTYVVGQRQRGGVEGDGGLVRRPDRNKGDRNNGSRRFLWACGISAFMVLGLYLLVRFWVFHNPRPSETQLGEMGVAARVALPPVVLSRFGSLLLLPSGLRVDHWIGGHEATTAAEAIGWGVAFLVVLAVLVWAARRSREAFFGLLWLLLSLLPIAGVVPLPNPVAERYLYVPLAGFAAVAAAAGRQRGRPRTLLLALALGWVTLTIHRNHAWRDERALWTSGVRAEPRSQRAWHNLGMAYLNEEAAPRALREFRRTLTLGPGSARIWNNLGAAHAAAADLDQAEAAYLEALKCDPRDHHASFNLATVYRRKGQLDKAIATLQKTIEFSPLNAEAHGRLAAIYVAQKELDKAKAECLKSLMIERSPEVFMNLGNIHLGRNELPDAIRAFREAVWLKPDMADAHYNLGLACQRSGMMEAAMYGYRQALAVNPDHVPSHLKLGQLFVQSGRLDEAVSELRAALRVRPFHADALLSLAGTYRLKGDLRQARACVEKCLALGQLTPKQAEAAEQELQRLRDH